MLFDFVDEWISVWTSGFEKSLVHLTSGSESLAKPLPHTFNTNKIRNIHLNVYFSILGLDFVVFQRNTPDIN